MEIKQCDLTDFEKIAKIIQDFGENINAKDWDSKQKLARKEEYAPKKVWTLLEYCDSFYAVENNRIAGIILLDIDDNIILGPFISKEYIGKNIGEKLLQFIEKHSQDKKLKHISVFASKTESDLFKESGFKLIKKIVRKMNNAKFEVFEMVKEI